MNSLRRNIRCNVKRILLNYARSQYFHTVAQLATQSNQQEIMDKMRKATSIVELEKLLPDHEEYTIGCCGNGCQNCVTQEYWDIHQQYEERKRELAIKQGVEG